VSQTETKIVPQLSEAFWPGPLTIVLRKRDTIPDIVTAGLETVAVRMSANSIFAKIVGKFGRPVAAPSANRFGRISPTQASHVLDELGGRIPLIVDGGPTQHGIESTIVRVVGGSIEILRSGPITAENLAQFAPIIGRRSGDAVSAPGQLPSHYAPRAKLVVVDALESFSEPSGKRVAALSFRGSTASHRYWMMRQLSERGDLREAATNLFQRLRELDRQNPDLIVAELVPEQGIGAAINERLRRAAG
jgi:L-threonylcarbamoyladenylate synthase